MNPPQPFDIDDYYTLDEAFDANVARLIKPGDEIRATTLGSSLMHATLGITGEAGEIADTIKKHLVYDQPLDIDNLREEVGDLLFYVQYLCALCNFTREDAMHQNILKLQKRYPNGYTNQAATVREDKRPDDLPIQYIWSVEQMHLPPVGSVIHPVMGGYKVTFEGNVLLRPHTDIPTP